MSVLHAGRTCKTELEVSVLSYHRCLSSIQLGNG